MIDLYSIFKSQLIFNLNLNEYEKIKFVNEKAYNLWYNIINSLYVHFVDKYKYQGLGYYSSLGYPFLILGHFSSQVI